MTKKNKEYPLHRDVTLRDGTVIPKGTKVPLYEAIYDMAIKCWRSDRRRAIVGDPWNCLIALGGMRHPQIKDIYVGSGIDAIAVIPSGKGLVALHFTIKTATRKILDAFDHDKSAKSEIVMLHAPARSHKYAHRRKSNARRRKEIRNGATVKTRGPRKLNRMTRIGAKHRPSMNAVVAPTS